MGHPKKGILTRASQQRHSNAGTPIWAPGHGAPQCKHPKMGILSQTPKHGDCNMGCPNMGTPKRILQYCHLGTGHPGTVTPS